MRSGRPRGLLVSLICDSGERYGHTYYNDAWIAEQGLDLVPHERALEAFLQNGEAIVWVLSSQRGVTSRELEHRRCGAEQPSCFHAVRGCH